MKDFLLFLLATAALVAALMLYMDYCINRPCPETVSVPVGMAVAMFTMFYLRYIYKLILKILNL